ncbi:MAG: ABC transporter substrate-binding protein [Nodosilinea sp.]
MAIVTFCLTVACGRSEVHRSTSSDCRLIQHALGETCVPLHPKRIVPTGSGIFENLLALGIEPIATVSTFVDSPHLQARIKEFPNIGLDGEPSIEKILAMKPDLILGDIYNENIYHQLSQIAPTVLLPFTHSGDWKTFFALTGDAVGKPETAQQVIDDYYKRLDTFKQQMGDHLSQTEVSIIYVYPDTITVYTTAGFNGTILQDAGLARPPAQNLDATATQQRDSSSPIQYRISKEVLHEADGDVIFVISTHGTPGVTERLDRLKADPLWAKLKAVQQGRVYEVPDYWIGSGPIAANALIDDLFKYLLEQPQS